MNYNEDTNFEQIKSLKHAKIKTTHNQDIMEKRISQARKEIESLRKRAAMRESEAANAMLRKANELEQKLERMLE